MRGMVQSLNVSVATSILLFEAIRQRELANLLPINGEGLSAKEYKDYLFEWSYPELIDSYKNARKEYPDLNDNGEIKNS